MSRTRLLVMVVGLIVALTGAALIAFYTGDLGIRKGRNHTSAAAILDLANQRHQQENLVEHRAGLHTSVPTI